MSWLCPRCGKVSYHPTDMIEGYCAHCHDWTGGDHRLVVSHDVPAKQIDLVARATLVRTIHGLAEHGQLELIAEHSHPAHCVFTVRASPDTRAGLLIVAQALPTGSSWSARWERE